MTFNYDKCKAIHFGKNNHGNVYTMKLGGNEVLKLVKTVLERNLGILVSQDLRSLGMEPLYAQRYKEIRI